MLVSIILILLTIAIYFELKFTFLLVIFLVVLYAQKLIIRRSSAAEIMRLHPSLSIDSEKTAVIRRYGVFLLFPVSSVAASRYFSFIELLSFVWIGLMLYLGGTIFIVLFIINYFLARYVSKMLNPIFFLSEAINISKKSALNGVSKAAKNQVVFESRLHNLLAVLKGIHAESRDPFLAAMIRATEDSYVINV